MCSVFCIVRRLALGAGLTHVALAASGPAARASAFVEKPGEGKIIILGAFDAAERYWTADGRLIPIPEYSKFNLSAFTEYGMDARTTLLGRAEIGRLEDLSGVKSQSTGAIGVRRLLFESGALRVGAQALASAGSGIDGMPARSSGAALDVRLAAAMTFSVLERAAFVEFSAGPHIVTGDWRGMRLDATLGFRPSGNWLLLLQSFNRFNEAGPFGGRARAHKAQASVMYDLTRRWSIIAGAFATVAARAERRQVGALTGVMRRF
jgi:hypothetical protein